MFKRVMSFALSALMVVGSLTMFSPMTVVAAGLQKTYNFSELESTMSYGLTSSVNASGELEISFEDQYKSQFFKIPADIDPTTIEKVTFEVSKGSVGALAFKLHTQEDYDSDNKGGTPVSYGNNVVTATKGLKVKYFSIMSLNTGTTEATVSKVTFDLSGEGNPGAADDEDASVAGENLIKNGNFDDADVSMWNVEQSGAKISIAESDTAIFDDVKTYGVINERTSPYECFAQDVTDSVQNGHVYAFTFYCKLSDDYAGAPDDQRQIDFAPYIVSGGSTEYLGSYSSSLSGTVSQSLTPGEWTKFEGTFKCAAAGSLDKVVIRLLEQGTNYGEGDCVKGEYYVTGVSLVDMNVNTASIQVNIPNLKDKFYEDFGEDMIVGTSISGGELSDEVLMQLVEKHFNAITLGNELKPDAHLGNGTPELESATINGTTIQVPKLSYTNAERYLDYIYDWNAENPDNQIKVRGHVLVWHSQTPEWFFHEDYDASKPYVTPEVMNLREEWYIKTILEHYTGENSKYKDLFYGWDVVNEAVSDSTGTYRNDSENSSWWAVYKSNEFIINAFKYANKYAPETLELYYNDYNDCTPGKVDAIVQLLKDVKGAEGTRIDAMGMQGHYNVDSPTPEQFEDAAKKYGEVVGKIMVTELDFKASTQYDGTAATLENEYNIQAHSYKNLYQTMKKLHDENSVEVGGFIVWGVIDCNSWLQMYTGVGGGVTDGRAQCPLLFDDNYQAKPAFWGIVDPTQLAPETHRVSIAQAPVDSFNDANEVRFADDNVGFIAIWNEGQLQFKIKVKDASSDASDKVEVFMDKNNSKTMGITCNSISVARSDGTEVDGGYEVIVNVPYDKAEANKVIGFDILVTDGNKQYGFNDENLTMAEGSKFYAEGVLKPYLYISKGKITVDGEIEEAWNNVPEVIPGNITDKPQASASFKVLWDDEYLYVYANVKDPVLNKNSEQVHEQDSIEVFIDETNSKADAYNSATKQYRINYANEHSFNGDTCVEENITSFAKETEDGYIIEAAIKWTEGKPEANSEIGIEFQINDADASGVRIGTLSWNDTTNQCWSMPSCYGTAMLVAGDGTTSGDGSSTEGKKNIGLYAGIGAAVLIAGAAGAVVLSKKDNAEENAESAKDDLVSDDNEVKDKSEEKEENVPEEKAEEESEKEVEAKEESEEKADEEDKKEE